MRKVREELRTGCVTGHVRTEGGHEGSLPPELTYTNVNAHRHLIQHYPHHPTKQHTKAVAFSFFVHPPTQA